jgi:hypothetical protein
MVEAMAQVGHQDPAPDLARTAPGLWDLNFNPQLIPRPDYPAKAHTIGLTTSRK